MAPLTHSIRTYHLALSRLHFSLTFTAGPWWMYAGLLAASVLIAAWSYRHTIPQTTRARRNLLITLRSLAIAAILLAIFQPILSSTTSEKITPSLAVAFDNSQSMTLPQKGHIASPGAEARRDVMIREAKRAIGSVMSDPSKASLYTVGERSAPFPNRTAIDSIRTTSPATDLSSVFSAVREARTTKNVGAIVLFTDGAFTLGENPVHPAEELGVPVYAVGLGDSTEPRDLAVTQLFTNEVGSIGTAQPVDVSVHYGGVKVGEHIAVELFEESQKIAEQSIELRQAAGDETLTFQYTPATEGVKKLTARISTLSQEATDKNNLRIAYVRVLKNKFHVVLFAGAPSSDVSFLEQWFATNPSLQLSTFIQKQGAEYYEGTPTREKLGSVDLVILAGWPIASTSDASIALVRQLLSQENRSLFFLASHNLDPGKLSSLGALPFTMNPRGASQAEMKVGMTLSPAAADNPVLHVPPSEHGKVSWEGLAPMFRTESHVQARPESQVLAEASMPGVKLGEPLIIARHIGRARQLAITGYGLWQWKLTSFGRERAYMGRSDTEVNALDLFLANASRWLTTEEVNKRVRIEPSRKFYQAGERIEFLAQVYNESYEPIERADVTVHITGAAQSRPIDLVFEGTGNGRYVASIPEGLPKGDYTYAGTAALNGRALGSDDGRFNVGDFNIELSEPRMRSDILRTLAERTGGKFYTPETAGDLLHDIYASQRFAPKEIVNTRDFELWNSWPLLVLAIIFFGTEWFIRKRLGML